MQDFEKLGAFYLGKNYDLAAGKPGDELVLYDAKDLTTHAVCVGMTGSGKTGLCLTLLEEAAIDGVPAIAIDPKGDLGNLLLTFPELKPSDFLPWVDPSEATRRGISNEQLAEQTATKWREGLAQWGQDSARIGRFRESVDISIYTPGSSAGLPLAVLRSFDAPSEATAANPEALRERVSSAAAGLLSLLGIEADPLRSREHILLSNIFEHAWREGRGLEMGELVRQVQNPPVEKVGVVDLESFFPAKERFALAMSMNNLLASPAFSAWLTGEPLDVGRLLYTPAGKPRLTILSIAHLSDAERMFFVTLLLGEVIAWMRAQSGTSSLRAILYMDEVFGYFPPSANPPSKVPMLTLLKQARAYGLGVVLATQNPVDLDYKGLSNAGTWFLGRLQTERDKGRVLDGLEGASTTAGAKFDRAKIEKTLSGLGNRVFLMNNVHEDAPVVFQSRWALSFLRGPLTRDQIQTLMQSRKSTAATGTSPTATKTAGSIAAAERPVLPPGVSESFLAFREQPPSGHKVVYRPALAAAAKVRYAQSSLGVDESSSVFLLTGADAAATGSPWESADVLADGAPDLEPAPAEGAGFAPLPAELARPKRYAELATALKDYLYRTQKLNLWKCATLKQNSKPGESEGDFRVRIGQSSREDRDARIEKLRAKYAPKLAALAEQRRKAEQRVQKESSQANQQTMSAVISFGSSVLGALFGRKLTSSANVSRAATSARAAGRIARERGDVTHAKETVEAIDERIAALDAELTAEIEKIRDSSGPDALQLEQVSVAPKKADIAVESVSLVWTPWSVGPAGDARSLS